MMTQEDKSQSSAQSRILDAILRAVGALTMFVLVFIATFTFAARIEYTIANPTLHSGTVTAKSYDDGHAWYSEYVIGRYSLRKRHGDGAEHFHIEVTDTRGRTDWWEVSKKLYHELEIGRSITRKEVQQR